MKYTYLILLLLIVGCKTKQSTTEITEKIKTDSTNIELTLNTKSTFEVKTLCDSITGLPKDFTQITENGTARATTTVKDNQLTTTVETDSTEQKTRIVKEYINIYKDKEVLKEKYPLWGILTIIILLLLFLFKERIPLINLIKL